VLLWRDISVDGADAQRYNVNTENNSARLYSWLESIADCDSDVMCSWTCAAEALLECVTTRAQAYDTTKHNTHNDTERQYTRKIRL